MCIILLIAFLSVQQASAVWTAVFDLHCSADAEQQQEVPLTRIASD